MHLCQWINLETSHHWSQPVVRACFLVQIHFRICKINSKIFNKNNSILLIKWVSSRMVPVWNPILVNLVDWIPILFLVLVHRKFLPLNLWLSQIKEQLSWRVSLIISWICSIAHFWIFHWFLIKKPSTLNVLFQWMRLFSWRIRFTNSKKLWKFFSQRGIFQLRRCTTGSKIYRRWISKLFSSFFIINKVPTSNI